MNALCRRAAECCEHRFPFVINASARALSGLDLVRARSTFLKTWWSQWVVATLARSLSAGVSKPQSLSRERAPQVCREFPNVLGQCGHDRRRVFAGHFDQRDKTRVTLHQRSDVAVVGAAQQIALPITWEWPGLRPPPAFP